MTRYAWGQKTAHVQTSRQAAKYSGNSGAELQNRSRSPRAVVGGFDSHTPLPRIQRLYTQASSDAFRNFSRKDEEVCPSTTVTVVDGRC
jgi:hypothetical protein